MFRERLLVNSAALSHYYAIFHSSASLLARSVRSCLSIGFLHAVTVIGSENGITNSLPTQTPQTGMSHDVKISAKCTCSKTKWRARNIPLGLLSIVLLLDPYSKLISSTRHSSVLSTLIRRGQTKFKHIHAGIFTLASRYLLNKHRPDIQSKYIKQQFVYYPAVPCFDVLLFIFISMCTLAKILELQHTSYRYIYSSRSTHIPLVIVIFCIAR